MTDTFSDFGDKRNTHQRRLTLDTIQNFKRALLRNESKIVSQKSFESLLVLIESIGKSVPGIGSLAAYDTCLRIGASMGCLPTEVYLHAGTTIGAKALGSM